MVTRNHVLAFDIGGTSIKWMLFGERSLPRTELSFVPTPKPATPAGILAALRNVRRTCETADRVAIGFPGIVKQGRILSAPNLDPTWKGVNLERRAGDVLRLPVRVINDAGMHGLGVIEGRGVEVVVTLGTGMGFALFHDGVYVPNIEMAHHPLIGRSTYEMRVGLVARKKMGPVTWEKHLWTALEQLHQTFNPDRMWVGGGNSIGVRKWPKYVTAIDPASGVKGALKLWNHKRKFTY